jgi:cyanuric acid amidohydrolase
MALLSRHLKKPAEQLIHEIPCVLSGGTEGVMSPHYSVFCVGEGETTPGAASSLAIGTAFSEPVPAENVGRRAHVDSVANAVRAAIANAGIERPDDVHFVQVKCPCVTVARAVAAMAAGKTPLTNDPNKSMAYARAAGAFGVAVALDELKPSGFDDASLLSDFSIQSPRASISSGVEVESNEVIVLGNSPRWSGPLRIAHRPMVDALDIGAVVDVLGDLGIAADPQVSADDAARIATVLVKCEPDRRGRIRGNRHTMLDDTDINAQRHIRGAVAGMVAGVIGDGRIFVSGGAEHQGPDGGGLIAVIAYAKKGSA